MSDYPPALATTHQAPLSLAERRERLALHCALDRAKLRLVLAPTPYAAAAGTTIGELANGLQTILNLTRFLPGKLGIWSRHAGLIVSFLRLGK